jgi:hypothetical protein
MVYKPRSERKRARGGKAEGQPVEDERGHLYNAEGSPESKEIDAKSDGFKRGGAKKRKHGGHVEGEKAKHHLGKRARGGPTEEKKLEDEPEHEKHGGEVHHRARGGGMEAAEHHHEHHEHHEKRARGGRTEHRPMARGGSPFSSARKTEDFENDKKTGPGEQAPVIP